MLEWSGSANFSVWDDLLMELYLVSQWFIGATDRAEEGKWIWADLAEQLPSDFPWADGQPQLGSDGNCLILQSDLPQAPNFLGRDFACADVFPHICQRVSD